MKTPNKYRVRTGERGTGDMDGANGVFLIPLYPGTWALCIVSDGSVAPPLDVWEHVSVSIRYERGTRTPTWAEMCTIKDYFWNEEDTVVQFHPPKSQYVNNHPNVLHLWRSVTYRQPMPPKEFV